MTTYDGVPSWPAGHKITAAEALIVTNLLKAAGTNGGLYSEQIFYKASNLTRTSTTTFADDPDLTCTLAANAVYHIVMHIHYAAVTAAGFKTAWTTPSGATGNRWAIGPGSSAVDTGGDNISMRSGVHNFGTSVSYGSRNSASNQIGAMEEALLTTTSSGTLALQWAQTTSSATGTVLGNGSRLIVQRLA